MSWKLYTSFISAVAENVWIICFCIRLWDNEDVNPLKEFRISYVHNGFSLEFWKSIFIIIFLQLFLIWQKIIVILNAGRILLNHLERVRLAWHIAPEDSRNVTWTNQVAIAQTKLRLDRIYSLPRFRLTEHNTHTQGADPVTQYCILFPVGAVQYSQPNKSPGPLFPP